MLTFSNITSFLKRNKKILYYTGFFVVLFMIGSGDVFATPLLTDGSGGGTTLGTDANPITPAIASAKTSFIQILNSAFKFIAMLLGLLTNFVGLFLNPSWTNGSVFGLETHLKSLWIFVSNIVYFIFALLLILIAFMNIVGKGDKWELKQALPKFIIGVLMVPFSWFLVNFIISVSSILGASILQLPYDTLKSSADTKTFQSLEKVKICTYLKISKAKKSSTSSALNGSDVRCASESDKKPISEILQGNSAYGMLSVYTYGIFSIDKTQELFAGDIKSGVETIFDLGYKTLIGLLLAIVYFILVLSLFLALFVRGIWLWLYMIFSPVFGLMIFFGKEKDGFMEGKFSLTELISLAMVPVYVSAALSFGLLFIFVAGQGLAQPSDTKIFSVNPIKGGSGTIINLMGGSKDGGFSFELEQSLSNSAESGSEGMSQLFKAFKGGLGTLIMQLFGIVVLWISVIAALKSSKVTGEIIEPIAAFGKSVGQLAMKSPQYMPVFGGVSAGGLQQIGSQAKTHYENKSMNTGKDFMTEYNLFGNAGGSAKAKEAYNKWKNEKTISKSHFEVFTSSMKSFKDSAEISSSSNARELIQEVMDKLKIVDKLNLTNRNDVAKALRLIHNKSVNYHGGVYDGGVYKRKVTIGTDFNNSDNLDKILDKGGNNGGKIITDPLIDFDKMEEDLLSDGSTKLKIDGNTPVLLNENKELIKGTKDKLLRHLVNLDTVGIFTKDELLKWLKDIGIGTNDKYREGIVGDVEIEISKLKKEDNSTMSESDFYKKK